MDVIKLPAGQQADEDTDCIKIERTANGRYSLITSALVACDTDDIEADADDSVAVISSDSYDTAEEAEAAGIAWAASLCVERLYVETSG